jgi:hypothetical protein
MLHAYFGGLGADKQTVYELALQRVGLGYRLTAAMTSYGEDGLGPGLQALWGRLRGAFGPRARRVLYHGPEERDALLMLLQAARGANLAELGQRFCYVLPSVPSQAGALTSLISPQLRHDNSLPFHPQLWQAGRSLETLPLERHAQAHSGAQLARADVAGERRGAYRPPHSQAGQ